MDYELLNQAGIPGGPRAIWCLHPDPPIQGLGPEGFVGSVRSGLGFGHLGIGGVQACGRKAASSSERMKSGLLRCWRIQAWRFQAHKCSIANHGSEDLIPSTLKTSPRKCKHWSLDSRLDIRQPTSNYNWLPAE